MLNICVILVFYCVFFLFFLSFLNDFPLTLYIFASYMFFMVIERSESTELITEGD